MRLKIKTSKSNTEEMNTLFGTNLAERSTVYAADERPPLQQYLPHSAQLISDPKQHIQLFDVLYKLIRT